MHMNMFQMVLVDAKFNGNTNMENPQLVKGIFFSNKEVLKEVMRQYIFSNMGNQYDASFKGKYYGITYL